MSSKSGDKRSIAVIHLTLSTSYLAFHQLEKAEAHANQSIAMAQSIGFTQILPLCFGNKGMIETQRKHYDAAITYFNQGMAYTSEDPSAKPDLLCGLGEAYFFKGRYTEAEKYLSEGLALARSSRSGSRVYDSLGLLAEVYTKQQKFELALDTYKQYSKVKDSIIVDKKEAIARMETRFEAEAEKRTAAEKIRRQNYLLISGAVLFLALACIYWIDRKRKSDKLERLRSENNLNIFRLQLNPHFMSNALNAISASVIQENRQKATQLLAQFAELMRGIFDNAQKKAIPLSAEIKMLEDYMDLERSRVNDRFRYEILVDQGINRDRVMIPPLMLQPFVENSILHGLVSKKDDGLIRIQIRQNERLLHCTIEDNGVGFKPSEAPKTDQTQHAIDLIRERLKILSRLRKNNGSLNIIPLASGTKVEINVPL
ncbi:histidine kinase [Flavobacterium sp.]|uniref:tetratricopeptide repeat-containing sensor histidine kinase n=1 Tax=Flavobacterium sp. TaxID=239 RepID=UPI0039E5A2BA